MVIHQAESLSAFELWTLLTMSAPTVVVGIPNPTCGLPDAHVRREYDCSIEALKRRGLVSHDLSQKVRVGDTIGVHLRSSASARHQLVAAARQHGKPALVHSFHFADNAIAAVIERKHGLYDVGTVDDVQA